jgi:diguanylate cyclase
MTRVQRELTKHFFLHDNEKMLITFSAAWRCATRTRTRPTLIKRADKAMYTGQAVGKNRVVVAE